MLMETLAVIDFETTGSAPGQGARATEIAAVLVQNGRVVDRFQTLMNSGAWVPPFIEQLTGISNAMLRDAPPAAQVMREVLAFTQGCALVAHNASFDRAFWGHGPPQCKDLANRRIMAGQGPQSDCPVSTPSQENWHDPIERQRPGA